MTDRELMQQALDALQEYVGVVVSVNDPNDWTPKVADAGEPARKAIEALRARLTEHEPYAAQAAMVASQTQGRMYVDPVTGDVGIGTVKSQRGWQGLTDEEVKDIVWNLPYEPSQEHIRAIEAKLKEKNT